MIVPISLFDIGGYNPSLFLTILGADPVNSFRREFRGDCSSRIMTCNSDRIITCRFIIDLLRPLHRGGIGEGPVVERGERLA